MQRDPEPHEPVSYRSNYSAVAWPWRPFGRILVQRLRTGEWLAVTLANGQLVIVRPKRAA